MPGRTRGSHAKKNAAGTPKHRHSLRNGLRLIRALPGVPGLLAVEPQEVVLCQTESADRRLKIYAAMRPVPIVFV